MTQTTDLYQEIILQHSRKPRHFCKPTQYTHSIKADNPLCGDSFELFLTINAQNVVQDACFQGAGCAISKASTSLMLEALIGKTYAESKTLIEKFLQMVKEPHSDVSKDPSMGKLAAFSGVWKFPSRVKCAVLSWHAMREILEKRLSEGDT